MTDDLTNPPRIPPKSARPKLNIDPNLRDIDVAAQLARSVLKKDELRNFPERPLPSDESSDPLDEFELGAYPRCRDSIDTLRLVLHLIRSLEKENPDAYDASNISAYEFHLNYAPALRALIDLPSRSEIARRLQQAAPKMKVVGKIVRYILLIHDTKKEMASRGTAYHMYSYCATRDESARTKIAEAIRGDEWRYNLPPTPDTFSYETIELYWSKFSRIAHLCFAIQDRLVDPVDLWKIEGTGNSEEIARLSDVARYMLAKVKPLRSTKTDENELRRSHFGTDEMYHFFTFWDRKKRRADFVPLKLVPDCCETRFLTEALRERKKPS